MTRLVWIGTPEPVFRTTPFAPRPARIARLVWRPGHRNGPGGARSDSSKRRLPDRRPQRGNEGRDSQLLATSTASGLSPQQRRRRGCCSSCRLSQNRSQTPAISRPRRCPSFVKGGVSSWMPGRSLLARIASRDRSSSRSRWLWHMPQDQAFSDCPIAKRQERQVHFATHRERGAAGWLSRPRAFQLSGSRSDAIGVRA
jgi:hypothetical protein